MNLSTQPLSVGLEPLPDTPGARGWLDALSGGTCDQATFLKSVNELLRKSPDEGWELLSLIDQYYRRGKLTPDVFRSLNSHLQALLMGNSRSDPQPKLPDSVAITRTVPVPVSPVAASALSPLHPVASPAPTPQRGAAESVASAPSVGALLRGRYLILGLLGQGAIGTVFEAVDQSRMDLPGDNQKVAIKVLHTAIAQQPELLAELRREFQQLQSLSHPNIVRVHEFDRDGNTAFFTMESLGGLLLSRVLSLREAAPMCRAHALGILRDIGAAVAHAHGRSVVHGDLNPGNIFVTDTGHIRVLNFGASYKLRRDPAIAELQADPPFPDTASIYASAQVLEGDPADARDDLYSLACIAYVLLTGQHPFQQYTAIKARSLRLAAERPDGIGRRRWQILRAGLCFERDQRPADLQAWLDKLDLHADAIRLPALPALMTARVRTSRSGIWLFAAAVLALLLGVAWWVSPNADGLRPGAMTLRERARPLLDTARSSLSDTWNKARRAAASSAATKVERTPQTVTTVNRPPALVQQASPAGMPHSRIELASDTVDANDSVARIVVRRLGSLRGAANFTWWTESGTAKPGRDFTPVKPQIEHLDDGKAAANLLVPITAPATRSADRSFYVVIDEPSSNATLGARTLTMVTIPASP